MLRSLSFAKKILLAAALVVVFAFTCFILYNDYRQREAVRTDTENYLGEIGTLTASNIQSWLEGRMHLVEGLASQLALLDQPDEANIARQLEQPVFSRNFASVYLGEAASGAFTMRPYDAMPEGYDPRTRAWYKDALTADRLIVTEPFVDAGTGEQILAMSLPVRHAGQLLGVAAGDMKLETLTAILNSLKFDGAGYAFLVSDAGKILLHPDSGLVLKTLAEAYPKGAPNIDPGVHEVELDGRSQFVSFTPVKGLPGVTWYVALVLDRDTAYSMLSEFRTSAIVATLIAVVGIMLLLGMLIRVLMQPLTDMGRGQAQREQAGEPAHRAAQVDGLAEVLAAVPFELHQHAGVAAPAAGRTGQGGQQQVVDLGPVGRRGFLQQLPGTLGVQGQDELALMAVFQGSVRVFAWQRMRSVVQLRLPVVEFVQARAGLFVQVPAPGLVGTATRPEIGVEVGIETLQVFQQDAPGHPVHRQVVDDQQQALAAVGHVHQQRTQQRPLFEVEAALGFFAKRQQRLLGPRLPAPQRLAGLLGVGLVPGAALFAETQAQGIVLRLQAFQGTPQPVAVERLARLQQERLVPVLAVGNRPLEEPALYRRQRHLAACRPLFRRRRTRLGRQGQAADVLVLEQVARAQLQSGLARTADYLDRDDRVAAEAEEVVVQADPLDAQQVLPDFRQGSLHCVARCAVACLRHAYFRRR